MTVTVSDGCVCVCMSVSDACLRLCLCRCLCLMPVSPQKRPSPHPQPLFLVTPSPVVPSTRVVAVQGKELQHGFEAFVAPTSSVVGDVTLGEQSSVWYGATVRGDGAPVKIGTNTAVQDNATVEGSTLGNDVTVAPGAVVSGASVGDGSMVGMGAKLLAGASVGANAFIDAGATVGEGTAVPAGELWTGSPAAKLRDLTTAEMEFLHSSARTNFDLSQTHFGETTKDVAAIDADLAVKDYRAEHFMEPDEPIPTVDPDVEQYYKLSTDPSDEGLFRESNMNDNEVYRQLVEEQTKADLEEDAYYTKLAQADAAAEAAREANRQRKLDPLP